MSGVKETSDFLSQTAAYQEWKKSHPQSFLSHFFCMLSSETVSKSWEIGFYDPEDKKITIFKQSEEAEDSFLLKPADEVFKQETDLVEELSLDKVKITLEQAVDIYNQNFANFFAREIKGDGFVILQKFKDRVIWNITLLSRSLKFLNTKIDAVSGEICSHQIINLVDKKSADAV